MITSDFVRDIVYKDNFKLALHSYSLMLECKRTGFEVDEVVWDLLVSYLEKQVPISSLFLSPGESCDALYNTRAFSRHESIGFLRELSSRHYKLNSDNMLMAYGEKNIYVKMDYSQPIGAKDKFEGISGVIVRIDEPEFIEFRGRNGRMSRAVFTPGGFVNASAGDSIAWRYTPLTQKVLNIFNDLYGFDFKLVGEP